MNRTLPTGLSRAPIRLGALACCASGLAALLVAAPRSLAEPTPDGEFRSAKTFACSDGGKLMMLIDSRFSAVVQSASGERYTLPNTPAEPGFVRIRWSDGAHTLTWDPGVHITWQDGRDAVQVQCNRAGGHGHGAPARRPSAPDAPAPPAHPHHDHASPT
jgi:hypothetical protein